MNKHILIKVAYLLTCLSTILVALMCTTTIAVEIWRLQHEYSQIPNPMAVIVVLIIFSIIILASCVSIEHLFQNYLEYSVIKPYTVKWWLKQIPEDIRARLDIDNNFRSQREVSLCATFFAATEAKLQCDDRNWSDCLLYLRNNPVPDWDKVREIWKE